MLNGNHDVMSIYGDLRYVSEEEAMSFGGWDARKKAFERFGKFFS